MIINQLLHIRLLLSVNYVHLLLKRSLSLLFLPLIFLHEFVPLLVVLLYSVFKLLFDFLDGGNRVLGKRIDVVSRMHGRRRRRRRRIDERVVRVEVGRRKVISISYVSGVSSVIGVSGGSIEGGRVLMVVGILNLKKGREKKSEGNKRR